MFITTFPVTTPLLCILLKSFYFVKQKCEKCQVGKFLPFVNSLI